MIFKKKKKKANAKLSQITTIADVKNKIREFFIDTQSPVAMEMSVRMGCTPLSDDVLEREEEESDKRLKKIAYLLPLLYSFSHLYTQGMVLDTMVEGDDDGETSPEVQEALDDLAEQVRLIFDENMANVLAGAVSQLVELDLLEIPKGRK